MTDEQDFNSEELEEVIFVGEDGEEMPFTILASKELNGDMYILAADGDEGDVAHFKCIPAEDDELIMELITEEHDDFKLVFNLFMNDYELLGIEIEDLD